MHGQDGVETIRALRRTMPAVRVIAMTAARGQWSRLPAARHVGARRTLLKPFGVEELLRAVQEVLAE